MEYETSRGNPHDPARLPEEQAVYELLDRLGIDYDRVDHEAAFTIDACADVDRALGFPICKNLFLRNSSGSRFYLLLMPGDKAFRTREVSAQLGETRLSFGDAERMRAMLRLTPGSVSVFGLLFDEAETVTLLVDRDLLSVPRFGAHPCINTSTVAFPTEDLISKVLPALRHEPRTVTLTGA